MSVKGGTWKLPPYPEWGKLRPSAGTGLPGSSQPLPQKTWTLGHSFVHSLPPSLILCLSNFSHRPPPATDTDRRACCLGHTCWGGRPRWGHQAENLHLWGACTVGKGPPDGLTGDGRAGRGDLGVQDQLPRPVPSGREQEGVLGGPPTAGSSASGKGGGAGRRWSLLGL